MTHIVTRLTFLVLIAFPLLTPAVQVEEDDPWTGVRDLVGLWEGRGEGFGSTSSVSHAWEFVLGGKFLRLTTRSVSAGRDGAEEVHEDVGYLGLDTDRGVLVFRQFFGEGYVNTYDVTPHPGDAPRIEFAHREAESAGGMKARMMLTFDGPDAYGMVLDLAFPGQDFKACQQMEMTRVR